MELSAPSHLGAQLNFGLPTPENNAPDTTRVNPNETSGKTSAEARQASQAAENASLAREQKALQDARLHEDRPAGPTPSFDISLLEVEQDLKNKIARIEATRGLGLNAQGIAPESAENTHPRPTQETGKPHLTDTQPATVSAKIETSMGMVYDAVSGPV